MSARSPAPWWSLHSPSPGAPPPRPTCHSPAAWAAWGFQDRTGPQAGGGADTGRPPSGGPRGRQEGLLRSLEALSWARCRKPLHFQAGVGYGFPSQAQCHPRQGPALTPPQGQRGGQTGHVQAGALWSLLPPQGSLGGVGRGGPGGGGVPAKLQCMARSGERRSQVQRRKQRPGRGRPGAGAPQSGGGGEGGLGTGPDVRTRLEAQTLCRAWCFLLAQAPGPAPVVPRTPHTTQNTCLYCSVSRGRPSCSWGADGARQPWGWAACLRGGVRPAWPGAGETMGPVSCRLPPRRSLLGSCPARPGWRPAAPGWEQLPPASLATGAPAPRPAFVRTTDA